MAGFDKDHKQAAEGAPRPMRPVCGADEANNAQLADTLAEIVNGIADRLDRKLKTVCRSTEEMIHMIEQVNGKRDVVDLVVFSTDIQAMFPSLDIDVMASVAAEEFLKGDLEVNLDDTELGLYLAIMLDRQKLVELGLGDVTHTRKYNRGAKPGITTEEIFNRSEKVKTKFNPPIRNPTRQESRLMFSLALEQLILTTMKSHIYSFNGNIHQQAAGGSIGSSLTGALAVMYQLVWSRKFKELVQIAASSIPGFDTYMLYYYIDDGNICCECLPLGSRLINGKIEIVQDQIEADRQIPGDIRTAKIMQEIGNSISSFIKLTVDTPSINDSKWMAILDLKVQVVDNKIIYKFHKKKMSNPLGIVRDSAMPDKVTRTTWVETGIRRMRNTSRRLPWQEFADTLSELSFELMLSGFNEKYRLEVIQAAVAGYEKQCARADSGGTPLHRPREYKRAERYRKKKLAPSSWYRPHNTVCFVPVTPGGHFAKVLQGIVNEELGRLGMSGRVVQTSGVSLKSQLVKLDKTGCVYKEDGCWPCRSGVKGASHTRRGALYTGQCTLCKETGKTSSYFGESGYNSVFRFGLHESDVKNRVETNAFHKHLENHHPERLGDMSVFECKVMGTYKRSLDRQVAEGTQLERAEVDQLLNSRAEYHGSAVPRVTIAHDTRDTRDTHQSSQPGPRGRGSGGGRGRGRGSRGRRTPTTAPGAGS